MVKKVVLGVVVLLLGLLVLIAVQPEEFRIERSAVVKADAQDVFGRINDFDEWPKWSPWEDHDPNLKRTISGAPSGVGAKYAWVGNRDVGSGKMEITESVPHERIAIALQFIEPWEAQNTTTFRLTPHPEGTHVSWVMTGKNDFLGKTMSLFMNIDDMVGPDFVIGLERLDKAARAAQKAREARAKEKHLAAEAAAKASESEEQDIAAPK